MAAVRDPAFWKRFSVAVHLDEESSIHPTMAAPSSRPKLEHSDSWLARQHKKKQRNRFCLCIFFLIFAAIFILIVLVLVWLSQHGWFQHGEKVTFP